MTTILSMIPNFIVRFAIAMLPFLGLADGSKSDTPPATDTEVNFDMKTGGGDTPMINNEPCGCPPAC